MAKTGTSTIMVNPARIPDVAADRGHAAGEQVVRLQWYEWIREDGVREASPKRKRAQVHGRDGARLEIAARMALCGQRRLAIRGDAEIVVSAQSSRAKALAQKGYIKPSVSVMVSTLFVDGRPVVGDELRRVLSQALAAADAKTEASREQIRRLDQALDAIGPPAACETSERSEESPFWFDPAED